MISFGTLFMILATLFFTLIVLFLYLISQKMVTNKNRILIDLCKEEIRLTIYQYLQDGDEAVLTKQYKKEYITAIFELLNEFSFVLKDPVVQTRLKILANKYMYKFITDNLKKRRWNERLQALYMIENFHLDSLLPELEHYYDNKKITQLEESQLLKLFAIFNSENLSDNLLQTKQPLSNFELLSIFTNMDVEVFSKFVERFDCLPIHYQLVILDTIPINNFVQFIPLLEKLLRSDDVEIQIRTLKIYAEMDISFDQAGLKPFLLINVWQLRLMAVKIVGNKKLHFYKDMIIECLKDQEFIVRKEAAKALLQLPDGEEALANIAKESTDRFAMDMANEWLGKE